MNFFQGQPLDQRYAPSGLLTFPTNNAPVFALAATQTIFAANETQSRIGYPSDPNAAGGDIYSIQMIIRPYLEKKAISGYQRAYNGVLEVRP